MSSSESPAAPLAAPDDQSKGERASTKLPRRRNGKEQACEPCRKAKMRCDHNLPVCQNCRRRNIIEKCIYVEAPQTRPKTTQRSGSKMLDRQPQYEGYNAYNTPTTVKPISNESTPGTSNFKEEGFEEEREASLFRPSSGFYGPTSFSAIYNEIESPQDQTSFQISGQNDQTDEQMTARTSLGIKVLNQLPNQATWDRIFELYASRAVEKSFHKPTIVCCQTSLWSNFGQALRQPRKAKDLREIAQLFSKNTMSVLQDTDDPDFWLQSLSGQNMRWEIMGMLFCVLGGVLLAIPEDDPFWATQSGRRMYRKQFAIEMKECVDECINLSNQMFNINMLMVSLLFKRNILESQCTGDTSLLLWRQCGDCNQAATGLGLHRDRDINAPPTISSEIRRRIWCVVFSIDKTVAAFTGRPPGLSHRYNSCPLPLDLSDEILIGPKEERARAISLLDSNGWNTNGEFNPTTSCRAVMMHSLILSEILEVSLGTESQYSDARLIDLKFRNDQWYTSFPQWLQLSKELPSSNQLQWTRFTLRLRYLHCSLLIEQLMIKRGQTSQQHLLDIAREMLESTVYMWVERDRFIEHHYDYDWMIMCYGIPSSGVLCIELLKQIKNPRSTHLRLPRSEVIQNLSLLIGFLDWIRPTAANRELCGRMSVIIRRILDQVLDPQPMGSGPETPSSELPPVPDFDFGQMNSADFDWLGTVDWTQGPFVDLGPDGYNHFQ